MKVRPTPCEACPYRLDVPSGLWAEDEYEKLRAYDLPTAEQPMKVFACHANPGSLCNGWAIVHTTRGHEFDLLVLRVSLPEGGIPRETIPLFDSGNDAADHGEAEIDYPSDEAREVIDRLIRKHPRLSDQRE